MTSQDFQKMYLRSKMLSQSRQKKKINSLRKEIEIPLVLPNLKRFVDIVTRGPWGRGGGKPEVEKLEMFKAGCSKNQSS